MKTFSNTPIFDVETSKDRLIRERMAIENMAIDGIETVAILNYWSDTTGECHAFPIFKSDKSIDVCNRYCDLFPLELKQTVSEVSEINKNLHSSNGMSKDGTMMSQLKVPLILYLALRYFRGDFWDDKKNMNWFISYMSKLRVGNA